MLDEEIAIGVPYGETIRKMPPVGDGADSDLQQPLDLVRRLEPGAEQHLLDQLTGIVRPPVAARAQTFEVDRIGKQIEQAVAVLRRQRMREPLPDQTPLPFSGVRAAPAGRVHHLVGTGRARRRR